MHSTVIEIFNNQHDADNKAGVYRGSGWGAVYVTPSAEAVSMYDSTVNPPVPACDPWTGAGPYWVVVATK